MAELAIRLFVEQPVAERDVLGRGGRERDSRRQEDGGGEEIAGVHTKLLVRSTPSTGSPDGANGSGLRPDDELRAIRGWPSHIALPIPDYAAARAAAPSWLRDLCYSPNTNNRV